MGAAAVVGLLFAAGAMLLFPSRARASRRVTGAAPRPVRRSAEEQRAIVEAVAAWAENLRDTMSAASGLEQAIVSTGAHAPRAIRPAVQRLVASLRYGTLDECLGRFADEVAHPTCDFVVAALVTSSRHQTRDVTSLLGHLAGCARSECDLYLRIWVSRARSRTAVRIITGAVGVFVAGLVLFNPGYLRPFATVEGCVVALSIAALFAGAIAWMHRIAEIETPTRFLAPDGGQA